MGECNCVLCEQASAVTTAMEQNDEVGQKDDPEAEGSTSPECIVM